MKPKIIVDTCSFIDYLRDGKNSLVPQLAIEGSILLSTVVRLELLKGAAKSDRKALLNMLDGLDQLEDFPPAALTEKVIFHLHGRGFNLGIADLLILTDAISSKSGLLTSDKALASTAAVLKVPLLTPARS